MSFAKGFVTALTEPEPNAKKTPRTVAEELSLYQGKAIIDKQYKPPANLTLQEQKDLKTHEGEIDIRKEERAAATTAMINSAEAHNRIFNDSRQEAVKLFGPEVGQQYAKTMRPSFSAILAAFGNKYASKSSAAQYYSATGHILRKATPEENEKGLSLFGMVTKPGEALGGFANQTRREKWREAHTKRKFDETILDKVDKAINLGKRSDASIGLVGFKEDGSPIFAKGNEVYYNAWQRGVRYIKDPELAGNKYLQYKAYAEDTKNLHESIDPTSNIERKSPNKIYKEVVGKDSSVDTRAEPFAKQREVVFEPDEKTGQNVANMQTTIINVADKVASDSNKSLGKHQKAVLLGNAQRESSFNSAAEGDKDKGGSVGLFQIHLPSHEKKIREILSGDSDDELVGIDVRGALQNPKFNIEYLLKHANGGALNNEKFMNAKTIKEANAVFVREIMISKNQEEDIAKSLKFSNAFNKNLIQQKPDENKLPGASVQGGPNNDNIAMSGYGDILQKQDTEQTIASALKILEVPKRLIDENTFSPELLLKAYKSMDRAGHIIEDANISEEEKHKKLVAYHNTQVKLNKGTATSLETVKKISESVPEGKILATIGGHPVFEKAVIPYAPDPKALVEELNAEVEKSSGGNRKKATRFEAAKHVLTEINSWLKNMQPPVTLDGKKSPANWVNQFKSRWIKGAQGSGILSKWFKALQDMDSINPQGFIEKIELDQFDQLIDFPELKNIIARRQKELGDPTKFDKTVMNVGENKRQELYKPKPVGANDLAAGNYVINKQPTIKPDGSGSFRVDKYPSLENKLSAALEKHAQWNPPSFLPTNQRTEQFEAIARAKQAVENFSIGKIGGAELVKALSQTDDGLAPFYEILKNPTKLAYALGAATSKQYAVNESNLVTKDGVTSRVWSRNVGQRDKSKGAGALIIKEANHVVNNAEPIKAILDNMSKLTQEAGMTNIKVSSLPKNLQAQIKQMWNRALIAKTKQNNQEILSAEGIKDAKIIDNAIEELQGRVDNQSLSSAERNQAQKDLTFLKNAVAEEGYRVTADVPAAFDRLFETVGTFAAAVTTRIGNVLFGTKIKSLSEEVLNMNPTDTANRIVGYNSNNSKSKTWHKDISTIDAELKDRQKQALKNLEDAGRMPANDVEERNRKIAAKITAMRQFYAIQLTYQYAGMVQGGSGGRAISNEDFQNLYRALWGGSGELAKPRIDAARAIVNKVYTRAKILIANTSNTDNHIVYMAGKTSEITNALFDKNIDGLLNTIVNDPSPVRQRRGPQVNAQGVKAALAKRLQPYATAAQVDLQTSNVMQVLANKQIPEPLSSELKADLIKRSGLELPFDTYGDIVVANVAASLKESEMKFTENEIKSFGVSSGNARNFATLSGYRMFKNALIKAGENNDFRRFVNGVIKTMLSPVEKQAISPINNKE